VVTRQVDNTRFDCHMPYFEAELNRKFREEVENWRLNFSHLPGWHGADEVEVSRARLMKGCEDHLCPQNRT